MKLKNATFIDLHIEKLVLGIGVLFLAYVAWTYMVAGGHTADVGGRSVAATDLDQAILSDAKVLEGKLNGPAHKKLQAYTVPDYLDQFAQRRDTVPTPPSDDGTVGVDRLAVGPTTGVRLPLVGGAGQVAVLPGEAPYQPLSIPAPTEVVVKVDMAAIDLDGFLTRDEFDRFTAAFGRGTPLDKQWVSLAARIDLDAVRSQLGENLESGRRPIPSNFIDEMFAIVDVQVERRVVHDDGTFGAPEIVSAMPARPSLRAGLSKVTVANVTSVIDTVRTQQADLLQPEFYPLRHRDWSPPQLSSPDGEEKAQPDAIEESPRIKELRDKIRTAEIRLKQINQLIERQRERGGEPGPSMMRRLERSQEVLRVLQDSLGREIQAAALEAERHGPRYEGEGIEPEVAPGDGQPNSFGGPILSSTDLQVWAHDLWIKPGMTYQYRVRVLASNPLFGRRVPQSQADLASQFLLVGAWSQWTDPVTAPQMEYFFVTGGLSTVGKARVQVWKFIDGRWATAEFRVEAGDAVGRRTSDFNLLNVTAVGQPGDVATDAPAAIDFTTNAIVVDLDFAHKLASDTGGIGLPRTTTLMIFTDGKTLKSRTESADIKQRDALQDELVVEQPQPEDGSYREDRLRGSLRPGPGDFDVPIDR